MSKKYQYYKEMVSIVNRKNPLLMKNPVVIWRRESNSGEWEFLNDKRWDTDNSIGWECVEDAMPPEKIKDEYDMESFEEMTEADAFLEMV